MIKKLCKTLLYIAIALVGSSFILLGILYIQGLQSLPTNTAPSSAYVPEFANQTLWLSETHSTEFAMKPLSLWDWIHPFSNRPDKVFPNNREIAYHSARLLLSRNTPSVRNWTRMRNEIVASIWISRHWTADEASRTLLAESYYGHGFVGIVQAAKGYFGRPVQDLTLGETALLVGLLSSPSYYDPWCRPGRAFERAKALAEKAKPNEGFAARLLPAPADACNP